MGKTTLNLLFALFITLSINAQEILINEYQSSNNTTISDYEGDYPDWIELINTKDYAINLEGWFLSDDTLQPDKWQFPAIMLPSGGLILIFASDKNIVFANGEIHTNFKLDNGNEPVVLSRPDNTICDFTGITEIYADWSYGRFPDASTEWFYFNEPTPGNPNTTPSYAGIVNTPVFSHDAGFYDEAFYLEISSADASDTIYFTLDGSTPTRNSPIYQSPILIKNRANEPNRLSLIQTTLPGQGFDYWQPPNGNVYKFNTVRAKIIKTNYYSGKTISKSFIVDQNAENLYTYPIISLITDSVNFFGDSTGIYVAGVGIDSTDWKTANFAQDGIEWERPVHVELFDKGNLVLAQDAGVRIGGHFTCTNNIKQLRLYARSEYGNSTFDYAFFPDYHIREFKRLRLRCTGNDAQQAYMRDPLIHEIVKNSGIDVSIWRPSVAFLDGEYWGIHNMRERIDEFYFEQHYNINPDSLDFLESDSRVLEGDSLHYAALFSFVQQNDMSDSINYQHVTTLLDPDNYITYLIINIYTGQTDWPVHNIRFWRKKTPHYIPNAPYGNDGRWRWVLIDQDFGLGRNTTMDEDYDHLGRILFNLTGWQNKLMVALLGNNNLPGNQTFRNRFINIFADHINTTFLPERMMSFYNMFKDTLNPEMPEHINRWRYPASIWHWEQVYCSQITRFIENRPQYMKNFIIQDFSLNGSYNLTVDNENPLYGKIRINTIHIDSTTLGISNPNQPYPWTGEYFEGVPIEVEAIPAPGYMFSHWEGASNSTNPLLKLNPEEDIALIAHFVERDLIHYWHFNEPSTGVLTSILSDYSANAPAVITYPGTGEGYMDSRTHRAQDPVSNLNLQMGQQPNQGAVLRVRNPSATRALVISAPTTAYKDIEVAYATTRTSNGATQQEFYYSTDNGSNWILYENTYQVQLLPEWELRIVDLSNISEVNNNASLKFKIHFTGENTTGSEGNNRFDNFTVMGIPLYGTLVYYSKPQGSLQQPNTWGTEPDGSGISPLSFDTDFTIYQLQNRTEATLTSDWTISGIGSKLIVGDNSNAISLIINAYLNANVDVSKFACLTLAHSQYPVLDNLRSGSTIIFKENAQSIPYRAYHHLQFEGINPVFNGNGNVIVNGNMLLKNSVNMPDARGNHEYNFIFTGPESQLINSNDNVLRAYNMQFSKTKGAISFADNTVVSADNQFTFDISNDATFNDNGITFYAGNSINIEGEEQLYSFNGTFILAGTEPGIVKGVGAENNFNIRNADGPNTNMVAALNNLIIRVDNEGGEFRFRDGDSNKFIIKGDFIVESTADGLINFYENDVLIGGNMIIENGFAGSIEPINTLTFDGTEIQNLRLIKPLHVQKLVIDNAAHYLTINGSIEVDDLLFLKNGKIQTMNEGLVIVGLNGEILGYGTDKYIEGKLGIRTDNIEKKTIFFPVGTNNTYLPAGFEVSHNQGVEMLYTMNIGQFDFAGILLPDYIDYIFDDYMYQISKEGNSIISEAKICLTFNEDDLGFDTNYLRLALYSSGEWFNLGGNINADTIYSTENFTKTGFILLTKTVETGIEEVQFNSFIQRPAPNPFNGLCTFVIEVFGPSSIVITDLHGWCVDKTDIQHAGIYKASWGGLSQSGQPVPPGAYMISVVTQNSSSLHKVIFEGKASQKLTSEKFY